MKKMINFIKMIIIEAISAKVIRALWTKVSADEKNNIELLSEGYFSDWYRFYFYKDNFTVFYHDKNKNVSYSEILYYDAMLSGAEERDLVGREFNNLYDLKIKKLLELYNEIEIKILDCSYLQ